MRTNTILNRYIFFELVPPFVINLFFFSFIFLLTRMLEIINLIVNYRVSLLTFGLMLAYSMPFFLEFIVPMSVMMAVLLTFLRMSGDNEIVALKSCGINPNWFLMPVLLFCLMGWTLTTLIATIALPWGNRSYYNLADRMTQANVNAVIKERTFIDAFEGVTLYINKVDIRTKTLIDVFIEDDRTEGMHNSIVAPRGRLQSDPANQVLYLRLFNGAMNQVDLESRTAHAIDFKTYEMKLDLQQMLVKGVGMRKPVEEMGVRELYRYLQETSSESKIHYRALMKWHEKFSLPFACFALGILAIPLGLQSSTDKRSFGIVLGIILFLSYYILLSVGWSFGESGAYPPLVGMWTPNVIMGSLGVYLYARMVKDRPFALRKLFKWLDIRHRWAGQEQSCKP